MDTETTHAGLLFVRDRRRRYQPASHEQVLAAARSIAGERTPKGAPFSNPALVMDYFRDRLAGQEREVFAAVFLDTRHRLLHYAELFFGTIDGAEVHPREVVRQALRHNAAAVIVAHNHPSGIVEPSAADRALTVRLKQALSLVEVRLLDHIVVGGNQTLSMAEKGLL